MSTVPKISSKFIDKLSHAEIQKVIEVCKAVNIDQPNWLLAVMFFETARTFSPSIRNGIGSVGLIQFTRDKKGVEYKTIAGRKYYLDELAQMSFIEQMDVVKAYLKQALRTKPKSFVDVYLSVFFPVAQGKSDDYVFQTSGLSAELIAKQNPIFDRNKDKKILKKEVEDYFREVYNKWGFDFDNEIKGGSKTPAYAIIAVFFYSVLAMYSAIS
ncbi:hypothetical protein KJK34_04660 [Flavobacterium sp. D11R37]|uniref:hypothetical protein n=1 Tax=Flavobacterium coralii TaxID=2838017 RepID=UPI001CA6B712|nr:hypothetical protein [Flavobacterium coralii]MBY8962038.1 hypothetical protein [Flavobacterium coralii]